MVAVCKAFGIVKTGSGSTHIRNRIDALGIDRSHFTGNKQFGSKNGSFGKIPLEQIMVQYSTYSLHWLKQRIIKENIILYVCICGLKGLWMDKKLSLQLDHINGDRTDNRKENLRFLCPNCHSQTSNFGSRNKKYGDNNVAVA